MSWLTAHLDKATPDWRSGWGGQAADLFKNVGQWGKDRLGFGSGKFSPTMPSWLKNDWLTGDTEGASPEAANLGLIGMLASGAMQHPSLAYSQSTYDRMLDKLEPLETSIKETGELSEQYLDPNSEMNQRMRDAIRGDELSSMRDVIDRATSRSTGTYGSSLQSTANQNVMTDAVAQALGNYTSKLGERQQIGTNLLQQQNQLRNAFSQAKMQADLAAMQAGQFLPQYLGQQFTGLMKYGLGGSEE